MQTSIVIMAAGKGTRMHSTLPKVLHKICGKPMLFYIIREALKVSDDVHVVLSHQAAMIKERLKQDFDNLHFHLQDLQNFPGTGGALMQQGSKKLLDTKYNRILILNGDMPLIYVDILENLLRVNAPMVLGILELQDPSGYGRILMDGDCVKGIVEEKDCTQVEKKIKKVNAGIYVVDKKLLQEFIPALENQNAQQEYYLTDIVQKGVQKGVEIKVFMGDVESFMGVNSKLDLCSAQEIMLQRLRKKAMLNGVIMHLPHTIYLEEDVEFVGECELQEGVRIIGKSVIEESVIKSHSVIEESIIKNSDVGPLAHIRPKSIIKDSHIGNFVEVKAGDLEGVKAGHLSYLGDCEIKKGSNIGAGVITCNYDGKNKHKTWIGENVFVGSDSQIIAPVKIDSEVLIGAGSTISKDCNTGDLVLSRVEQKNVTKGYYKFFKGK